MNAVNRLILGGAVTAVVLGGAWASVACRTSSPSVVGKPGSDVDSADAADDTGAADERWSWTVEVDVDALPHWPDATDGVDGVVGHQVAVVRPEGGGTVVGLTRMSGLDADDGVVVLRSIADGGTATPSRFDAVGDVTGAGGDALAGPLVALGPGDGGAPVGGVSCRDREAVAAFSVAGGAGAAPWSRTVADSAVVLRDTGDPAAVGGIAVGDLDADGIVDLAMVGGSDVQDRVSVFLGPFGDPRASLDRDGVLWTEDGGPRTGRRGPRGRGL